MRPNAGNAECDMATLSATRPTETAELGDYVSVLRRRWRWPLVGALLGVALALAYTQVSTKVYTAHAEVLVTPQAATLSSARPDQLVSMPTEAQIAASGDVAAIARRTLGASRPVSSLLDGLEVSSDPESLVLDFAYTSATPAAAAAASNAFARAYIDFKEEQAAADTASQLQRLQARLAQIQSQRDKALEAQQAAIPGSPQEAKRSQQVSTLNVLLASVQSQITTITPGLEAQQGELILSAPPPLLPSSPNPPIDLALGLFVGVFIGTLLAFVRDRMDEKIRGRRHLADVIDAPVLAVVPHANVPRKGAWLATLDDPRGAAAESYRTLRTNILAMASQHDMKLIAVTSAMPGEGKSTTSANLAVTLAQAGKNTLLVSGDLRKPGLSRLFGMPNAWGLVDVLRRGSSVSDVAQGSPVERLRILNTGPIPGSPSELLQSSQMRQLFDEQRTIYDFVVVDCSPVLGLADALAIAPNVDGVLLVASERTKQGAIAEARAELDQVGGRVVGTVMNDVPMKRLKTKAYGYGGGNYGYADGHSRTDRVGVANGNGHPIPVAPQGTHSGE
jgi:capsular exopolysaccharide synthesis family protein